MCLGHQFCFEIFQQHSFILSVCAVAVLVELWFLSVVLLFILTFNVFFRFVKTYIVQRQLYFSYRQFIFIFCKPHLSNAILLFILKLGAYLTLRTRLTYFAMDIFCILFLNFGTLSGYLWYTFGLLLVQSLAAIHVCVAYCIVLLCATITTRKFHSLLA